MQDSLNNWDGGNLDSIQGVYADESIGTSILSVSRVTEPAISHPPEVGGDSKLLQQHQNWLQLRVRHQRAIRKIHRQYTIHVFLRLLCRLKRQLLQSLKSKRENKPNQLRLI